MMGNLAEQISYRKDGQSKLHNLPMEGMRLSAKKELTFTCRFVDKYTGEDLGSDPVIAFSKLSEERRSMLKALMLEIKTGKPHKAKHNSKAHLK